LGVLSKKASLEDDSTQRVLSPRYGSRYLDRDIPRYELPEEEMPADVAYQLIHDELNLDGNPALNLATFVTTWMEPEALQLVTETLTKNFVDQDEYPQSTEIQTRCVNMLARLYHAPAGDTSVGCATIGSSEAIHLAGLSLKWRWRARRPAAGLPDDRPNLVMGHNVQVCWEKFARYFEVEPRFVPMTEDRYTIGVPEAMDLVDDHTIGVVGVLGSTYTGEYEPIEALNAALLELNARTGWDVPIHVDAASGGFVAPFLSPDLKWDFRLPLVRSINVSGHKFGLVFPGVGWVIWRSEADLPEDLVFHVNYLGGDQPTFNLNFSKSASQIIAQYYNFLRLGRRGYTAIMENLQSTAAFVEDALVQTGHFDILSKRGTLPLVCFKLRGERGYTEFDLSDRMRERGWILPAYNLAPDAQHISVLRAVVREGLSRDLAGLLVDDLARAVAHLEAGLRPARLAKPHRHKTRSVC
jgi:glutamate decarboxylase